MNHRCEWCRAPQTIDVYALLVYADDDIYDPERVIEGDQWIDYFSPAFLNFGAIHATKHDGCDKCLNKIFSYPHPHDHVIDPITSFTINGMTGISKQFIDQLREDYAAVAVVLSSADSLVNFGSKNHIHFLDKNDDLNCTKCSSKKCKYFYTTSSAAAGHSYNSDDDSSDGEDQPAKRLSSPSEDMTLDDDDDQEERNSDDDDQGGNNSDHD